MSLLFGFKRENYYQLLRIILAGCHYKEKRTSDVSLILYKANILRSYFSP